VLHRRLGEETVSHYFERELWAPLGAEYPASYSLDSDESGIEKFFGGFNARARDFAKLGLLFLDGGSVSGRQLLPRDWVEESVEPDPVAGWVRTTDGDVRRGKYQWFLTADGSGYFAKGYKGQYVFVVPARRMVFVRFGAGYGNVKHWTTLFARLAREL
jgi:CubicO group peptidase (beta-lactamase class C family)